MPKVQVQVQKVVDESKYGKGITDFSKPRICAQCGKRYWRRDIFELWAPSMINGSPIYHKLKIRLCIPCVRQKTNKLLMLVQPTQ